MKFRDLRIGDTFDWIEPNSIYNSFYERCTKISTRRYTGESYMLDKNLKKTNKLVEHTIGTINAKVYHVNQS